MTRARAERLAAIERRIETLLGHFCAGIPIIERRLKEELS